MYHVPKLIEEREMEQSKENSEVVNVEELITELLKQMNWDQKLGGANVRGSAAQQSKDCGRA